MKKEVILRLASLSRIQITDEEAKSLNKDIDAVLAYVGVVNDIAADASLTKKVGARYNIFREDNVTREPNAHTEDLLAQAPAREGRFLKVKKILQQD